MLGLPFVFKSAGWIGGFFVTTFFAFVTWRTSALIGRELNGDPRPSDFFDDSPFKTPVPPGSAPGARMLPPIKSFPDIARVAFGEAGCYILSFVLYFELFSCLCIFFVTLGDHLHALFPMVAAEKHMTIVAVFLTVPTTVLRTPKLLSYLSMVGTVATVSVVLCVMLAGIIEGDVSKKVAAAKGIDGEPYHILWRTSGLPLGLGLVAYTFSGHAIVPSIYSSMERPQDFERMIDFSFLCVLASCLVVAVGGYHMFGSVVEDQITISLTESSSAELAMKCLTWLMILTAFSKFTLTMFPLALGLEEIFSPCLASEAGMEVVGSLIKLVLIVLALAVAIFVPSFSFLCALVGLICTMIVSVVFPAAAHLKMFGPRLGFGERLLDWMFVVFGSIVAVIGTFATIQ
jgi:vesicular inhibitory amino acid transporter